MDDIMVLFYKKGNGYDITDLCSTLKWSGRKGSAARSSEIKMLDDDGYHHDRCPVDVEEGDQILLMLEGKEHFRGMIMDSTQTQDKTMTIKAYDNAIYLANNKDSFQYKNKTADKIFSDVCSHFSIPTGSVAKCSHTIAELIESKKTAWDTIQDALSQDYKATKVRHYVQSNKGKISLVERKKQLVQWMIEPEHNLINYAYKRSISNITTRVKVLSSEGKVTAQKINSTLESKIGIFQDVESSDKDMTKAQINELIQGVLDDSGKPSKSLTVTALGKASLISGVAVYVTIPALDIARSFYIDEDTHTYTQNSHTMQLTLNYADDVVIK